MQREMVKKITPPVLIGGAVNKSLMGEPAKPTDLFVIMGIATGTKTGVSNFGEWTALTGEFVGINIVTGVEYTSGKAFVPGALENIIIPRITGPTAGQGVVFNVMIGMKPDPKFDPKKPIGTGYVWTVRNITEMKDNDAMGELRTAALAVIKTKK